MTSFKERKCRACGSGIIKLRAEPGRTWRYKRLELEVPAEFEIPTCDRCGEQWLDPGRAEALDDHLKARYNEALMALCEAAITTLTRHRSQRSLEQLLGLSQGYLSKLLSQQKTPSESLLTGLMVLARDPDVRLQEAEEMWLQANNRTR